MDENAKYFVELYGSDGWRELQCKQKKTHKATGWIDKEVSIKKGCGTTRTEKKEDSNVFGMDGSVRLKRIERRGEGQSDGARRRRKDRYIYFSGTVEAMGDG